MSRAILVIDDDPTFASNVETFLGKHDFDVNVAHNGEEGLLQLVPFMPDVVLLDFRMDGMNGLEVLSRIREHRTDIKVVLMTGHADIQLAVEAMKAGAYDFLSKPFSLAELKHLLERAIGQDRITGALTYYQGREARQSGLDKILGVSGAIRSVKANIQRFIAAEQRLTQGTPPAILVTGETGVGKELVARAFHFDGARRSQPFVEINCAAIPSNLMEAELFGFEKGAFTDAKERKLGLVEMADGGTLFLDEIGEMDLCLQAKLLRVLDDGRIRRVGGLRDKAVDARIIAATNQSLEDLVKRGEFRSDLYYRLKIIQVDVPPLRARDRDISFLANAFLKTHCAKYGRPTLALTTEAERALERHSWPGNVRELRNAIEQAVLISEGDEVDAEHLAFGVLETQGGTEAPYAPADQLLQNGLDLEELEVYLVTQALGKSDWNISHAARLLGLTRDTLRYRIDKHNLRAPH